MRLKIVSTKGVLVDEEVEEVVVPVKDWEVGILPWHEVYAGVVKWGLCKFKLSSNKWNFITEDEYAVISVGDWVVYTDGKEVRMAVSQADVNVEIDEEELSKMKENLEKKIEEIKTKGSIEDIEKVLLNMNKILADIQLVKLKKKKS